MAVVIMAMIMRMPMVMVSIIIIPIVRSPWIPVRWVMAPIPW
jgi:hypothetical protein